METVSTSLVRAWVSVEQVAQEYNVSNFVVRGMIRDGDLPAVKVGREWRIPRASLPRPQAGD